MPSRQQNQAKRTAAEGGYVDWVTFYAEEKERLKVKHPDWTAGEIKKASSEAYQKQKENALAAKAKEK